MLDRYEGYEVKCIPDMTPEEVERHIALTARALRQAADVRYDHAQSPVCGRFLRQIVANIARAWATQGHAVTVVCQEHEAASLSFVNEAFFPGDDLPNEPPADGRLRVVLGCPRAGNVGDVDIRARAREQVAV